MGRAQLASSLAKELLEVNNYPTRGERITCLLGYGHDRLPMLQWMAPTHGQMDSTNLVHRVIKKKERNKEERTKGLRRGCVGGVW